MKENKIWKVWTDRIFETFLFVASYALVFLVGAGAGLISGITRGALLAWDRYFPYVVELFLH